MIHEILIGLKIIKGIKMLENNKKEQLHEFSNDVHLEWLNNRMLVVFLNPISINGVNIPKGFITDGATIPKLFWNILSPFGRYFKSCALHDYVCLMAKLHNNSATDAKLGIKIAIEYRKCADTLLSLSMKRQKIGWFKRATIMSAVRTYTFFDFKVWHRMKKHDFKIEPYYVEMLKDESIKNQIMNVSLDYLKTIIDALKKG